MVDKKHLTTGITVLKVQMPSFLWSSSKPCKVTRNTRRKELVPSVPNICTDVVGIKDIIKFNRL